MSTSVVLPLGCGPLPQTPNHILSPHGSQESHAQYQSLDDVFQRELVLHSTPSPKRKRKVHNIVPVAVLGDESLTPTRPACQFFWKERPRPEPVVLPCEVPDSASALQFIRKTPVTQESPNSVGSNASSPHLAMARSRRQGSTGLLLEDDPDCDEKKVVPARNLWLKARQVLRQAGLNPRNVTLVEPYEAEHAEGDFAAPIRKQWRKAKSDTALQVPDTREKDHVGGAGFLEESGQDSTSCSVPKDALGKLLDEHLKLKTPKVENVIDTSTKSSLRTMSRTSTKSSLEPPNVRRIQLAALGAATFWKRRAKTLQ